MENNKRPGGKAGAMEGKGFYIVLFLCAAVVVASAWTLLSGAGTDVEETEKVSVDISDAVVTMLPAGTVMEPDEDLPVSAMEGTEALTEEEAEDDGEEEETSDRTWSDTVYVWPVRGTVEVPYAVETLRYDATMADWRVHDGIDIACQNGDEVIAAADGTVVSVFADDLYGTVVEIDHGSGVRAVYANLAAEPPVWEGMTVTMGQTIGSVGGTALAETNEVPHLHLSMTVDGVSANPEDILPGILTEE